MKLGNKHAKNYIFLLPRFFREDQTAADWSTNRSCVIDRRTTASSQRKHFTVQFTFVVSFMTHSLTATACECQFIWLYSRLGLYPEITSTLRNKWLVFSFLQEITWRCSCAHMTVWTMAGEINEGTVRKLLISLLNTMLPDHLLISSVSQCQAGQKKCIWRVENVAIFACLSRDEK